MSIKETFENLSSDTADTLEAANDVATTDTEQLFVRLAVAVCNELSQVRSAVNSVAFGHLPSYKVRMVGGLDVATSADYAFNKSVQTYRFQMRLDGNLSHASHVKTFRGYSA